jgi:hypothetical protein
VSDERFFGIIALLMLSAFVVGFVIGWCIQDSDDDD